MSDFTISWNSSKTKHCENYHGKPTRIATSLAESWSSQRRHENRFVHFSTSLWVPHRLEDLLKMGEGVACRATQVMGHARRHAPLSIWPAPFHFSLSKPTNVIIKRCKRRMMKAETGEHQESMLKQQRWKNVPRVALKSIRANRSCSSWWITPAMLLNIVSRLPASAKEQLDSISLTE